MLGTVKSGKKKRDGNFAIPTSFSPARKLRKLQGKEFEVPIERVPRLEFDNLPNIFENFKLPAKPSKVGFQRRTVSINKRGLLEMSEDESADEEGAMTSARESMESLRGDVVTDLERVYERRREQVVDKNGFIHTPLHLLKTIAIHYKERMHIENYLLTHPDQRDQKVYRVDILVGPVRGTGQCSTRQLARQLAAIDMLEKLVKNDSKIYKLDPYTMLPGWRVDTSIEALFRGVCKSHGLPMPKFQITLPENSLGKVTAVCRINDLTEQAESEFPWLAKKLACKKMIEKIMNSSCGFQDTLTGRDVIGFTEMKQVGFIPVLTDYKREWVKNYRTRNGAHVQIPDEPNDGGLDEMSVELSQNAANTEFFDNQLCKLMKSKAKVNTPVQSFTETNGSNPTYKVERGCSRTSFKETQPFDMDSYDDCLVIGVCDSEDL